MSPVQSRALDGKVALVTGACTGIGKAIATHFGRSGAAIAVNHRHTPELAETVLTELRGQGITAIEVDADVSVREELGAGVERLVAEFGRWDILVSNAAIATTQPLVDFDEPTIDAMVAVNVKAVIWGMQLAAARMNEGGRIITLGSSTTGLMLPGYAVYDATKAGVEQITRLGTPGEIAEVATFLASDQAGWITGQVIRVNGGTV